MKSSATVSAPGKLLLLGDHAVVYGEPCLVTAVGQRVRATLAVTESGFLELHAPDVGVTSYSRELSQLGSREAPKTVRFVETAVRNFLVKNPSLRGISITTSSEFAATIGFGSSSAIVVSVLRALSHVCGVAVSPGDLFQLAYQTVLDVQGVGSGFDVSAAVYGGTLCYVSGGKTIEQLSVATPLPIVVGYTGVKADTPAIVRFVAQKRAEYPERVQKLFTASTEVVEQAKVALCGGDWKTLGKLMTYNQEYLRDLGVSSEKLETLIGAALSGGAFGAKLSGAGGGDCMIAVVDEQTRRRVIDAIIRAGGTVPDVSFNAPGVSLDTL